MTTTAELVTAVSSCPSWCFDHEDLDGQDFAHLSKRSRWAGNLRVVTLLRGAAETGAVEVVAHQTDVVEILSASQARLMARALLKAADQAEGER